VGPTERANVLLITLDTTRADRLGCYAYSAAQTPTLDSLAASGARFEQAFAQVPLTLPSHASLFTGSHPLSNGIHINGGGVLSEDLPTLAEEFSRRGYETGAFIAACVLDSSYGLDRGFDHYDDRIGDMHDSSRNALERRADEVCNLALAWLDGRASGPFFAWVHFFDPHHPYDPPEDYHQRFADPYDGEIAFVDTQVRRLVDWVEAHHLRERTLIVVFGDHGESFEEHDEIRHGLFVYNTTLQVPLIFSFPSRIPAGRVISTGVRLIDVMPTVLDLVGWEPPAELEGESLTSGWRTGESVFLAAYGETEYPRLGFGWAPLRCLTTERWKYIDAPRPELYDRLSDPQELDNIIEQHSAVARALRERLAEMVSQMKPRPAGTVALNSAELERLASLGYVAGPTGVEGADSDLPRRDPKEMTPVFRVFNEALRLVNLGKHGEAVTLLEPIVRRSPESDRLHGVLGEAYMRLGRFRDAQRELEAGLRTFSNDPSKWCRLGEALRAQGKTAEAIGCYRRALEECPDWGPAYSWLGFLYAKQGDYQRAHDHYRRCAELNPRSPKALTDLANLLPRLGRAGEAVELLKKALKCEPGHERSHQALWRALLLVGRRREAIAALRAARESLPSDGKLMCELAWLLSTSSQAELRNGEEAVGLAERCREADPKDARSFDVLAAAYAETGDFARAVETAARALSLASREGQTALQQQIEMRLRLYRSGRAYRQ